MRPITDVLRDLNGGKFIEELTDALQELALSCRGTGKPGSMTISLKMKPGKGGASIMTLEHDFKVKSPEFERPSDIMFVTKGGDLVCQNPDQGTLPLRIVETVDRSTGEIREVVAA